MANQNVTFPLMLELSIIEFTCVQLHMQIRIQKEHAISALVFQPSCCAEYSLNPSGVRWENKKHFYVDRPREICTFHDVDSKISPKHRSVCRMCGSKCEK